MDFLSPTWLQDLIQAYGLWVVFAFVMLDSLGIPLPGETALVTAALYAGATQQLDITSVLLVAATAAIVGDNLGYLIGRSVGIRVVARYAPYVLLNQARLKTVQYLFLVHGGKIVFLARFVAFLRIFAAFLAGVNRMNFPRFLIINAVSGICWASLFGGGAFLLGQQMNRIQGPLSLLLLITAIGLAVAAIIYFRRHEQELEQRAVVALPGPWLQ